jgi:formate/nitrite transporter FocA (FNT family)
MLNADPTNHPSHRRPARNSMFLVALIIVAAIVISLQYTPYAMFSREKTSMLWGMLTGLIIGGFIFGWLKLPGRNGDPRD